MGPLSQDYMVIKALACRTLLSGKLPHTSEELDACHYTEHTSMIKLTNWMPVIILCIHVCTTLKVLRKSHVQHHPASDGHIYE